MLKPLQILMASGILLLCCACVTVPAARGNYPDLYISGITLRPTYKHFAATPAWPSQFIGYTYEIEIVNLGPGVWDEPVLLSYFDAQTSLMDYANTYQFLIEPPEEGLPPQHIFVLTITIPEENAPGQPRRFEINPVAISHLFPGKSPIREENYTNKGCLDKTR